MRFVMTGSFDLVAAFRRTQKLAKLAFRQKTFHLYFLNKESDYYREIDTVLRSYIKGVSRVSPERLKRLRRLIESEVVGRESG